MNDKLCDETIKTYRKFANTGKVANMDMYIAHGKCTTLRHSLGVAYVSLYIFDKYKLKGNRDSVLRSALLHDYYLYDWHNSNEGHRLHGFRHGTIAAKNAARDYELTDLEIDCIMHHMFPLTLIPPKHIEGGIVMAADKICALYEMYCPKPYQKLYEMAKKSEE